MKGLSVVGITLMVLMVMAPPTSAQEPIPDATASVELLNSLSVVEEKILVLADEFEVGQYDWRPTDGVRSTAEVFMHVATINFAFPLLVGHDAPASTGMTADNLRTAAPAYENSLASKDPIHSELQAAFDNLRSAIETTSASGLEREVDVFGSPVTLRGFWMNQLTHLHEHLGQLIAYGRINGVAPPWSQ